MVVVSIKPKPGTMETLTLLISKKYIEAFIETVSSDKSMSVSLLIELWSKLIVRGKNHIFDDVRLLSKRPQNKFMCT